MVAMPRRSDAVGAGETFEVSLSLLAGSVIGSSPVATDLRQIETRPLYAADLDHP
jgi:hypothetical protein